jgi:hypothetical protein
MKEDGEPDAGDLHVRFDGREVETGKGMEGPQNRGRRTGAEDDRKVGDGISLLLFSNTTWISLHRATSRPYSLPATRIPRQACFTFLTADNTGPGSLLDESEGATLPGDW